MRKIFIFITTISILLSFVGCAKDSDTATTTKKTTVATTDSRKKYDKALKYIESAITCLNNCAKLQYEWLDEYGNSEYETDFVYFFKSSGFENAIHSLASIKAEICHDNRQSAIEDLDKAYELLKNGSGNYYEAVRQCYVSAVTFKNYISTFPSGQRVLVVKEKLLQLKEACATALTEASLY